MRYNVIGDFNKKKINLSEKIIVNRLFEDIVFNKGINMHETSQQIMEYKIDFRKHVALAVIEPIEATYNWVEFNHAELCSLIDPEFREVEILDIIIPADRNSVIVIFSSDCCVAQDELSEYFSNIIAFISEKFIRNSTTLTAGLSNWHGSWKYIRKAYEEACIAVSLKSLNNSRNILFYSDTGRNQRLEKANTYSSYLLENNIKQSIIKSIEQVEVNEAKQKFTEYFEICIKTNTRRECNYKFIDFLIQIKTLVAHKCSSWNNITNTFEMNTSVISESILSMVTINDLKHYMCCTMSSILEGLQKAEPYYSMPEIKKVFNYIEENYGSEISLNDVSALLYMSPSYFSSFFKQKTGMTFSDFLKLYRVNKAKALLKTQKYSLDEVSQKVGYGSYRYFRTVFKGETGMTPKSFQNRSINMESIF